MSKDSNEQATLSDLAVESSDDDVNADELTEPRDDGEGERTSRSYGNPTPEDVRDPPDDLNSVYKMYGPYPCKTCGGWSWKPYRCDNPVNEDGAECGTDLASGGGSGGRGRGVRG